MKAVAECLVPAGVVTKIFPVTAPTGTFTLMELGWTIADPRSAATDPKEIAVVPLKVVPLIVTSVPTGPLMGEKLVILGRTVKGSAEIAVCMPFVTLIGAVTAPGGTFAVIVVDETMLNMV